MPGYYADDIETSVRSRRGIPGLDVYETERRGPARSGPVIGEPAVATRPVTPTATLQPSAIKGLDIAEGITQARNPNVSEARLAELRAARAAGAAPAATVAADIAAPAATRGVGLLRGAAALANPLTPPGLALTAATAIPALAEAGRERGAGRDFNNPNAGNPAAGDLRPGQLGQLRSDALQQSRGEALRAAYQNPQLAAADIGSFNQGVQNRANQVAVDNTPAAPAAPPSKLPQATYSNEGRRTAFSSSPAGALPDPAAEAAAPTADIVRTQQQPIARAPTERSAIDIERAALGIEQQNSVLRQQADAYGPGARNPDGSGGAAFIGSDIAAKNRETGIASLRNDARLASGLRQKELLDAAQQQEGLGDQAAIARERNAADVARATAGDATARRGQDIAAGSAQAQLSGQRDIAALQGTAQRDVAKLGADSRLAAAEARADATKFTAINLPDRLAPDGLTVLKGGQVLVGSDGKVIPVDQQAAAGSSNQAVTPKAEYEKLPKGAKYVGPDGKTYQKG